MAGRPKGTTRRSALDAQRADQLKRLGWSRQQIGELFNDERGVMRAQIKEFLVRVAWTYHTGLGFVEVGKVGLIPGAWAELKDPARAARQYVREGVKGRLSSPKAFQKLLAKDLAFQRSVMDVDGKRPFVRERRRPGRRKRAAR